MQSKQKVCGRIGYLFEKFLRYDRNVALSTRPSFLSIRGFMDGIIAKVPFVDHARMLMK